MKILITAECIARLIKNGHEEVEFGDGLKVEMIYKEVAAKPAAGARGDGFYVLSENGNA